MQPHRLRYWLNAKEDERKEERIADICSIYQEVPQTADAIAFSIDEMTGIQALKRIAEDLHRSPGKPVAREFEYQRNGTQTLIAAMNITLGKITAHCGDTRTEIDTSTSSAQVLHILLKTCYNKIRASSGIIS